MEYEKCILCGETVNLRINTHIDLRYGYIIGAGQLCEKCYNDLYGKHIVYHKQEKKMHKNISCQ